MNNNKISVPTLSEHWQRSWRRAYRSVDNIPTISCCRRPDYGPADFQPVVEKTSTRWIGWKQRWLQKKKGNNNVSYSATQPALPVCEEEVSWEKSLDTAPTEGWCAGTWWLLRWLWGWKGIDEAVPVTERPDTFDQEETEWVLGMSLPMRNKLLLPMECDWMSSPPTCDSTFSDSIEDRFVSACMRSSCGPWANQQWAPRGQ